MTLRPLALVALAACAPKGPAIEVRDPYSYESVLGNVGVVYFTIENRGTEADTLADVEVTGALVAMMHEQVANGAMVEMRHLGTLPLPPRVATTQKATRTLKPRSLRFSRSNSMFLLRLLALLALLATTTLTASAAPREWRNTTGDRSIRARSSSRVALGVSWKLIGM